MFNLHLVKSYIIKALARIHVYSLCRCWCVNTGTVFQKSGCTADVGAIVVPQREKSTLGLSGTLSLMMFYLSYADQFQLQWDGGCLLVAQQLGNKTAPFP